MISYAVTTGYGNVAAGAYDDLCVPGIQRRPASKYGVVLCRDGGGLPDSIWAGAFMAGPDVGQGLFTEFVDPLATGSTQLAANLSLYGGIPWVASDLGDSYGNASTQTAIASAVTYLSAQTGIPTSKILLLGIGAGAHAALRYAINNASAVAGVVGVMPLTNLVYLYNMGLTQGSFISHNFYDYSSAIATAWGVTAPRVFSDLVTTSGSPTVSSASGANFSSADNGKVLAGPNVPVGATLTYISATQATISSAATGSGSGQTGRVLTALPAGADIQSQAASFTVPGRLYYSSNDPVCLPNHITNFAAVAGAATTAVSVGSHGHVEQTITDAMAYNGTNAADIISFLLSNGA